MLYNFLSGKGKMKDEEVVSKSFFPSVTFLLPGWNEGVNIKTTINSIQNLNYPKDQIKIIYIDNNSTDNSKEIVDSLAKEDSRIVYLFETKQGKHNAMNTGLKSVDTELVACLDVDSTLDTNAMSIAASYFQDPEIKALASCMQLRDVKSIWQRAQAVEYMLSIFWRKSYSNIDAIQVMPGPFSVFRSSVFTELGNYKKAHNAEDFEMTLRLHKNHYRIANAHKAYVYTVGPETFRGLVKQRVRWIRGFLENAWDYRFMFFKKEYGNFGLFTLPVGAIFVFYVLYAVTYSIIKLIQAILIKIENYYAIGIHLPKLNLDPFYITVDVLLIQSIFIFTILAVVLIISRGITNDKSKVSLNFAIYFLIYLYFSIIYLCSA
jgi:cellulose synthase/poly-beta-1,6-N-acetylglucosamine synthase-like glycosyltransferase